MNRVLGFDARAGLVECEAGTQWPELMDYLERVQEGRWSQWGVAQKQTGADRLSLGGALAANVHGRGLAMKPFIDGVESFVLIDAVGEAPVQPDRECRSVPPRHWGLRPVRRDRQPHAEAQPAAQA